MSEVLLGIQYVGRELQLVAIVTPRIRVRTILDDGIVVAILGVGDKLGSIGNMQIHARVLPCLAPRKMLFTRLNYFRIKINMINTYYRLVLQHLVDANECQGIERERRLLVSVLASTS